MNQRILALLAISVVVSGCATFTQNESEGGPNNTDIGNSTNATVVQHSGSGFSPQTVTVEKGETVTWVSGNGNMWVGSDRHPDHTDYSGTSRSQHCQNGESDTFDQCTTGQRYRFTFNKTGEWNYHNHANPGQRGTVIVE